MESSQHYLFASSHHEDNFCLWYVIDYDGNITSRSVIRMGSSWGLNLGRLAYHYLWDPKNQAFIHSGGTASPPGYNFDKFDMEGNLIRSGYTWTGLEGNVYAGVDTSSGKYFVGNKGEVIGLQTEEKIGEIPLYKVSKSISVNDQLVTVTGRTMYAWDGDFNLKSSYEYSESGGTNTHFSYSNDYFYSVQGSYLFLIPLSSLPDQDNDGISDFIDVCHLTYDPEEQVDTDLDRFGDSCDSDDDNDGMPDDYEITYGMDPKSSHDAFADNDDDFIINIYEYEVGTSPIDSSSKSEYTIDFEDSFESGESKSEWQFLNPEYKWEITDVDSAEGEFSMAAPKLHAGSYSKVTIKGYFLDSTLSFYAKLEQSNSSTQFRLFVDGEVVESFYHTDGKWKTIEYDIKSGFHEFVFYSSCGSYSNSNTPRLYLDDIQILARRPLDPDRDGDGVPNMDDAFIDDYSEWEDSDGDLIGNNADEDDDNDGVIDEEDFMPLDPNERYDTDQDGVGDNADVCNENYDPQQLDSNNNGIGNACDELDIFPYAPYEFDSNLADYFVLDDDKLWFYNSTENGTNTPLGYGFKTWSQEDKLLVEGGEVFLNEISVTANFINRIPAVWVDARVKFDKPVKILTNAHMDGSSIVSQGVAEVDLYRDVTGTENSNYYVTSQFIGRETVKTPMGYFDTVHMKVVIDLVVRFKSWTSATEYEYYSMDLGRDVDLWLAKGVGLVKWSTPESETFVKELVDTNFLIKDTLYADPDQDGVVNKFDALPHDADESADFDQDGIGDNADLDDDNDGVPDLEDDFPYDSKKSKQETSSIQEPKSSGGGGGNSSFVLLFFLAAVLARRYIMSTRPL